MRKPLEHSGIEEDASEHVTIELYHNIPLTNDHADNDHEKATAPATKCCWHTLSQLMRWMCCCRRGQEFQPLTLNDGQNK